MIKHIHYRNCWKDQCSYTDIDLIKIAIDKQDKTISLSLLGFKFRFIFKLLPHGQQGHKFYENVTYIK